MKNEKDIPLEVLREAWVAGTKAMRKEFHRMEKRRNPDYQPPTQMKDPELAPFAGTEFEPGIRAAAKVILKWAKE